MEAALKVTCPVCDASPGAPCREHHVTGLAIMAVPIHLSREFHQIYTERKPMAEPFAGMQKLKSVLNVEDLKEHEEVLRELQEQHDREMEQGSDIYGQLND